MKRPMLVSGITAIITLAVLIYAKGGSVAVPVAVALVLFLCFFKRTNLRKHIIIPTVCICSLIFTASFFIFNYTKVTPVLKYDNQVKTAAGRVNSIPSFKYGKTEFVLKADKIDSNNFNTHIHIVILGDHTKNIQLFDYISLNDTALKMPKTENLAYDYSQFADGIFLMGTPASYEKIFECNKTPFYYCLTVKDAFCDKITDFMNTNHGGLLKGILFGDTADIDDETDTAFKQSGIAHLLAVSGMHTSLYCAIIIAILSVFGVPEKTRNIICIIFLICFSIMCAFTPSVLRSALMAGVVLLSPFFKKRSDSFNSLGLSVVLLLLFNPYTLLSVSFQLSAAATLGVLFVVKEQKKFEKLTSTIQPLRLERFIKSLLQSVLMSISASLFTLPISSYYYGVFSILAPLTNLLTVQISFIGTVLGIISTGLSFININFIREITIVLFNATQFILDIIVDMAKFVANFKFCTIPVHKEFLIIGTIICVICLLIVFGFLKLKNKKAPIKVCATACVILLFTPIFIPLLPTPFKTEITVLNTGNNLSLVIRNGTKYALIENTSQKAYRNTYDNLPKATCEALCYYIPTYLNNDALLNLEIVSKNYNPEKVYISKETRRKALESNSLIPQNATLKENVNFSLSDEINVQIVDTNNIKYAIIRGKEKNVYIHLYGDTDFSPYTDTSPCDVAIYNGKMPDKIPQNAETIILSGEFHSGIFKERFPQYNGEVFTTAQKGNLSFYI